MEDGKVMVCAPRRIQCPSVDEAMETRCVSGEEGGLCLESGPRWAVGSLPTSSSHVWQGLSWETLQAYLGLPHKCSALALIWITWVGGKGPPSHGTGLRKAKPSLSPPVVPFPILAGDPAKAATLGAPVSRQTRTPDLSHTS